MGADVGKPVVLLQTVQKLIREALLPPTEALQLVTSNPASILGLADKGRLEVGLDADLLLFDRDWDLSGVIARGEAWSLFGKTLRTGFFG